jgi:hypothetical protein
VQVDERIAELIQHYQHGTLLLLMLPSLSSKHKDLYCADSSTISIQTVQEFITRCLQVELVLGYER